MSNSMSILSSTVASAAAAVAPVAAPAYANPALTAQVLSTHGLISQCILPFFEFNYGAMASFLLASPALRINRNNLAIKLQLESNGSVNCEELRRYERLSGTPITSDKITRLVIQHSDLSDEGLKAILDRFPKLEKVFIEDCPNITRASLNFFPNNLRDLGLWSITLYDEDLAILPNGLQQLRIAGNELTDAAILNTPRGIQEMDIYSEQFTDACIPNLPQGLRTLTLQGNQFTGVGILKLPLGLERLYMPGITHLTDDCIIQLVLDRPNLSALYCNEKWFDQEALDQIRAQFA